MLCRQWIWLKRFRHRRGYGVHSPFAFDFLTYVVYERGEYYAYRELKKRYPVVCLCGGLHRLKCRKFLFRLSNYVHPSLIRIYGHVKEAETAYLAAGCRSAAVCQDLFWKVRVRENGGFVRQKELMVVGGNCTPALDGCGFASVDKVFGVPPFRHTGFKSGFAGVERRETLAGSRGDFRSLRLRSCVL